jgi:multiple sugar transport system ATP-binding protein
MNVFAASVDGTDQAISFGLGEGVRLDYAASAFAPGVRDALLARRNVVLGIRPYAVKRSADGVRAQVAVNQWLGDQTHIAADFAGGTMVLVEHDRTRLAAGDAIGIHLDPSSLHVFDSESGKAVSHGVELA